MIKKIFIAGTGAMASLYASFLAQPGLDVVMFGSWNASIEKINSIGLQIYLPAESIRTAKLRATNDPSECSDADLVLVLVKSWQTEDTALELFGFLPDGTPIVTLQNGLGNKEILGKYFGLEMIVQGVTTMGAVMLGPGEVKFGGKGVTTLEEHPASKEYGHILNKAGLQVNIVPDAGSLIWGKLVISSAVNPLTAILGVTNGELLNRPSAMELVQELAKETCSVAAALGVKLPFSDPQLEVETVLKTTAVNVSSMLQDVQRGSRTEIDSINGTIVVQGEKLKINVPMNRLITKLIQALSNS